MKSLSPVPQFLKSHPITFAIVALLVSKLGGLGIIQLIHMLHPDWSIQKQLGWLLMLLYSGICLTLVYWTDTAEETGLARLAKPKEWLLWIPFLLLPLLVAYENGLHTWGFQHNLLLILAAIGVAVNEEVLFRGVFLRAFLRMGTWNAVVWPSLLFGLTHATNIFVGGNPLFAILQTVWTTAGGISMSALRLRSGSLYPVIALHIVEDGVEYFSTGEFGVHTESFPPVLLWVFLAMNVGLAVYSVLLLHRSRKFTKPSIDGTQKKPLYV